MGHDGIAAIGGEQYTTKQELRIVERFSLSEKRWERLPDMPSERSFAGATMWRGKLIVVGGWVRGRCLNTVEAYDAVAGAWQAMPSLLHPRVDPELAIFGGALVVFDGWNGGVLVDEVEQYDADAQLWKVIHRVKGGGLGAVMSLPRRLWT
uniref:Uncharacterized protein n=1 Tax=Eutreptiella gymnastica TaxID=73025 RepID=A0A7S4CC63_9EUGL